MFSTQWRDEDEEIVDDEAVIQLACWASGVYDKQIWYSGDVSDDVWELIEVDLTDAVTARIEAGASWNEAVKEAWREAVNDAKDGHDYVVRMMDAVSFRVAFDFGTDTARITEAVGWVADEVQVDEGTHEQIRAEAHRLVDRAVKTERCSKYANRGAGGERKRNVTKAKKLAALAPQRVTQE